MNDCTQSCGSLLGNPTELPRTYVQVICFNFVGIVIAKHFAEDSHSYYSDTECNTVIPDGTSTHRLPSSKPLLQLPPSPAEQEGMAHHRLRASEQQNITTPAPIPFACMSKQCWKTLVCVSKALAG